MTALFAPAGLAALRRLGAGRTLLCFDLDGTLAPLVNRPSDARVPAATARRLQALSRHWPLAVITGRSVRDANARLGFTPHCLFGNHGAERAGADHDPAGAPGAARLDASRQRLTGLAAELCSHGITVEDKGLSLALHYRRCADQPAAQAWLATFASTVGNAVRASAGHCVLNLTPAGANHKGDALREALRACGAVRCLVVGDDANDEPAFVTAPAGSVSVRIGPPGTPTRARFRLERQEQVDELLALLVSLPGPGRSRQWRSAAARTGPICH